MLFGSKTLGIVYNIGSSIHVMIFYEKNDASYNLPKLIKTINDLPHILTWIVLFFCHYSCSCPSMNTQLSRLTSWIINLLTNQILQLSCKILDKAVKLRTQWMWIFNILHCINYRIGLGWCKLFMVRTHTKNEKNKERKKELLGGSHSYQTSRH